MRKEIIDKAHEYCTKLYTQNKEKSDSILVDKESYEIAFDAFVYGANHNAATQAVEFAKWVRDNYDMSDNTGMWLNTDEEIAYTTEQLYQIYLKETGA